MTRASDFQPGDHVTIADEPNALTWEVIDIRPGGSAYGPLYTLKSGLSGRRRYETADRLAIHTHRRITS